MNFLIDDIAVKGLRIVGSNETWSQNGSLLWKFEQGQEGIYFFKVDCAGSYSLYHIEFDVENNAGSPVYYNYQLLLLDGSRELHPLPIAFATSIKVEGEGTALIGY